MKPKIKSSIQNWIASAIIFSSCGAMAGETNKVAVVKTNMVTAAPNFRVVNGRLYNIEKSQLWESFDFKFIRMEREIIIARKIVRTTRYEGNQLVNYSVEEGPPIAIQNFKLESPTIDQQFTVVVIRNGVLKLGSKNLELYDYGKPHAVAVVTTNFAKYGNHN